MNLAHCLTSLFITSLFKNTLVEKVPWKPEFLNLQLLLSWQVPRVRGKKFHPKLLQTPWLTSWSKRMWWQTRTTSACSTTETYSTSSTWAKPSSSWAKPLVAVCYILCAWHCATLAFALLLCGWLVGPPPTWGLCSWRVARDIGPWQDHHEPNAFLSFLAALDLATGWEALELATVWESPPNPMFSFGFLAGLDLAGSVNVWRKGSVSA